MDDIIGKLNDFEFEAKLEAIVPNAFGEYKG